MSGGSGTARTFGLVHGGAHGAWCWTKLVPELERHGFAALAVDLPCEDEAAGAGEYAEVAARCFAQADGAIVLVGHSLGGLTIPLLAEELPAAGLIFLTGLIPSPGRSLRDQQTEEPEMLFPYHGGPAGLRDRFYHRCRPADADWAMSRLRTQALKPFVETTPLTRWPAVPAAYLLATEDRACNPDWGRKAAADRLGVEPIELIGSDHSPFLSRPAELARVLVGIARSL